jgi:hypothetical protein
MDQSPNLENTTPRAQTERRPRHFCADNEILDDYGPKIGAFNAEAVASREDVLAAPEIFYEMDPNWSESRTSLGIRVAALGKVDQCVTP